MFVAYPNLLYWRGGSVISSSVLAKEVSDRGYDTAAIVSSKGHAYELFRNKNIEVDTLQIPKEYVDYARKYETYKGKVSAIYYHYICHLYARKWLKVHEPDLVDINDGPSMVSWGAAAKQLGIPVVWHVRMGGGNSVVDEVRIRMCDYCIYVAENIKNRFRNPNQVANTVIYNDVDREKFSPGRCGSETLSSKKRVIGYVGDLVSRKRPLELYKQCESILQNDGETVLALVGLDRTTENEITNKIKKYAQDAGIENQVYLPGYVNNIYSIMSCFDVLCLPSKSDAEAFPRVIVEALASGVPVVASNTAGIPEIVRDGYNGFLFDPSDVSNIKKCVKKVMYKDGLQASLKKNALESIGDRFKRDKNVSRTIGVYNKVLSSS